MKQFAQLVGRLEEALEPEQRVAALAEYFQTAPADDGAWALRLLLGPKIKRVAHPDFLKATVIEVSGFPLWLFDECMKTVGDVCETIALILPETIESADGNRPLAGWIEEGILPLAGATAERLSESLCRYWTILGPNERLVLNKIVVGAFRSPVKQEQVVRALALAADLPVAVINQRLSVSWTPSVEFFESLISHDFTDADASRPYPLRGVAMYQGDPSSLGELAEWHIEWKWDGIRAQVVRRNGQCFIWSRSEELISNRFPQLVEMFSFLPDGTVLDGEIVAWSDDMPAGRAAVLRELDRARGPKGKEFDSSMGFVAFDVLEFACEDIRERPFFERREILIKLLRECPPSLSGFTVSHPGVVLTESNLMYSEAVSVREWDELMQATSLARRLVVEGLVLKRLESSYGMSFTSSHWHVCKASTLSVNAVLMYAERGVGSASSTYISYTVGVWKATELVPIGKIGGKLLGEDAGRISAFIESNTLERFGPVRTVKPELVLEISFEGIESSARRKAGIVLRSPEIVSVIANKASADADTIEMVKALSDIAKLP